MQAKETGQLLKENRVLKKQRNYRRSLQMPVLSIHDSQKKVYSFQRKGDQAKNQQNKRIKLSLVNRVYPAQATILQCIHARKQFEVNKDVQLQISSQSYSQKRCLKNIGNRIDRKQSRYSLNEHYQNSTKIRLKKKISRIKVRPNLSLVMQKRNNNVTQRPVNEIPKENYSTINNSYTGRQMTSINIKLIQRDKLKRQILNCFRSKVANKLTESLKMLSKSYQSSNVIASQEKIYGWQTNHRAKQAEEFNYCPLQSFIN